MLKEELGAMVDKEMVATATAIEEAVLRMDVRTLDRDQLTHTHTHTVMLNSFNLFLRRY